MELTGSFKILRSSPNMTSHTPHLNSGRDPLQALSPNIRQSELSSTGKGIISPASQDRLIKRELAVEHANSMHLIPNPRSPTMARDVVAPSIVSTPSADQVMSKQSASDTVAHSNYPQWGGSPLPLTQSLSGQGSLNAPQTQSAANNLNSSADVRSSSLSTDSRSPLASKHNLLDDSATVTATGNIGELPSKRIPNQNVNRPFLGYIDYYYESSPSVRSLPLAALVDMAWTKWKALPEKSKEKEFFLRPVQSWIRNADGDELLREENHRALEDVKPEVPIDGSSQHDQSVPILDFQDDFGPIDNTNSQTITKSPEFKVQDLMAGASLEQLETFVARAVKWLDCLRNPLQKHGDESTDATQWLTAIDRIKGYAARTKTVIGVVGNTGAGKSSVINAMLDEEQLLPTNTMRACTAVVTEISYNHEEGRNYRAEVEFIDEASWHAELKILFSDLVDEDGKVVRDCGAPDSDAGIAYAKIKAVYPKKTKEDIGNSSISSMLKEVSHILGKTQKIQHDDSLLFYRQLQRYIDSQEKVTAKMTPEEKKKPREMEFWPLIKVVRIHCRSQALATGATIVDLPGVHDANAARAAVAEGYMKQCSGLWIVAPIIRAVDDKAAKNLLGQTFKRQLKMDGGFGQVSFICSKTDDISLMEATASLGLEETNGPLWEEADQQIPLRADLETNIKECNDKREGLGVLLDTLDSQVEVWEQLQKDFDEDGKPVYAPASKKRKSRKQFTVSRKKQNRSGAEDDDFIDDGSEVEQESDNEYASDKNEDNDDEEVSIRKPLTSDKISEQLTSFREQRKATRKQRAALNNDIKDLKEEINLSKETEKRVKAVIAQACIKGRNGYSKQAIQQDFAAGIRELDQENAQEEDAENFNPEEDIRDYDEIAKSLPVFCVSSRGYQQLQDRRKKDAPVTGFDNVEQTEIPALQEHCKQLTVSGRTQACKKFLVAIGTLANSLALWASSDGTNNHLTPEQREKEHKLLSKSLQNLDNVSCSHQK